MSTWIRPKPFHWLPSSCPTGAVFGRQGKPASHWLYVAQEPGSTQQFKAPGGAMIVEYRSTGGQTIAPPSVTSRPVRWDHDGQPARVDAPLLLAQVKSLAAGTALLARCWAGSWQPSRCVPGARWWSATGRLERRRHGGVRCRGRNGCQGRGSARPGCRRSNHGTAPGRGRCCFKQWPALQQIIGEKAVRKVCDWLGVTNNAARDAHLPIIGTNAPSTGYGEKNGSLYWYKRSRTEQPGSARQLHGSDCG